MNNCRPNCQYASNHRRKPHIEQWKHYINMYGQQTGQSGRETPKTKLKNRIFLASSEKEIKIPEKPMKSLSSKLKNFVKVIKSTQFVSDLRKISRSRSKDRKSLKVLPRLNSLQSFQNPSSGSIKDSYSTRELQAIRSSREMYLPPPSSHALLEKYHELRAEQLEKIIAWKQAQIQLIKKQGLAERNKLIQQIERLEQSNQDLTKCNKILMENHKSLEQTVMKLQKDLEQFKQEFRSKSKEEGSGSLTMSCSGVKECSCQKEKGDLKNNDYQLQKYSKLNEQYQAVICDLHIQNRFYKRHLDKCGETKKQQFIEAQRKIMKSQGNRKKM